MYTVGQDVTSLILNRVNLPSTHFFTTLPHHQFFNGPPLSISAYSCKEDYKEGGFDINKPDVEYLTNFIDFLTIIPYSE